MPILKAEAAFIGLCLIVYQSAASQVTYILRRLERSRQNRKLNPTDLNLRKPDLEFVSPRSVRGKAREDKRTSLRDPVQLPRTPFWPIIRSPSFDRSELCTSYRPSTQCRDNQISESGVTSSSG